MTIIEGVQLSIELAHIELVGVGSCQDGASVEDVFELDFVESSQIAFQGCVNGEVHRKEERSPGMRSGSERTCLSCLIIIAMALP